MASAAPYRPAELPQLWPEEELSAAAPRRTRSLRIAGGLFAAVFLLAALAPIGGAVLALGEIGVESRVKRIAHPTGGVIKEIAVRNGDHVRRGQLLMRLDDSVSGADALYSTLTVEQLLAQRARLEAERLGSPSIAFPPELTGSRSPSALQAMAEERKLFAIRQGERAQLRSQIGARVAQVEQEIAAYGAQIEALRQQRALIGPELQNMRDLRAKGLVTVSRLNQLERTAIELDGQIASLNAQIGAARARIAEARSAHIEDAESRRAEAGRELGQLNTALNQQQVRRIAAGDQQNRSEIRAPYAGIVDKIAFAAIGDVIKPAEPLMEILPDADRIVVEALVDPQDIEQVRVGQQATVLFSSLNRSATPELAGKVSYVAVDSSEMPETRRSYYLVRIAIAQSDAKDLGVTLRSGIPAEVHIATGDRSLLSYILKPLRDQLSRAFRDN